MLTSTGTSAKPRFASAVCAQFRAQTRLHIESQQARRARRRDVHDPVASAVLQRETAFHRRLLRHYNLAYAFLRGRPRSRCETNPCPVNIDPQCVRVALLCLAGPELFETTSLGCVRAWLLGGPARPVVTLADQP